jgi:hypothetical protein
MRVLPLICKDAVCMGGNLRARTPKMQNPAVRAGFANPFGVERGNYLMVLSMLYLLLSLIRKRRIKFSLQINLYL